MNLDITFDMTWHTSKTDKRGQHRLLLLPTVLFHSITHSRWGHKLSKSENSHNFFRIVHSHFTLNYIKFNINDSRNCVNHSNFCLLDLVPKRFSRIAFCPRTSVTNIYRFAQ